jgi:S-adenosylmethionine decarboxylase
VDSKSLHVLAEYFGCDRTVLDDQKTLLEFLYEAAELAKATPLRSISHRSQNGGHTVVLIVSESHFALHTQPTDGYASADFYTCGKTDPEAAAAHIGKRLLSIGIETMVFMRGTGVGTAGGLISLVGRTVSGSVYEDDTDPG